MADNFDCNISSMNGLKQTHSLAIMLLQQEQSASESTIQTETIPRMKKTELKDVHVPDIVNQFNTLGPKKPDMPMKECIQKVPPLKVLAMAGTAIKVASELLSEFMKSVTRDQFDTRVFRLQHQACS